MEIVSVSSATNDTNPKSVDATCTGSKKALGGGARVSQDADGFVAITGTFPFNDTTWRAEAREIDDGDDWSLTAYVICADVPPP